MKARLRSGRSKVRMPVEVRNFLFSNNVQIGSRAYPPPRSKGNGAASPEITWPGHNVKHSPPPNVEGGNKWSYTTQDILPLHVVKP
jgi:hypothetical protein